MRSLIQKMVFPKTQFEKQRVTAWLQLALSVALLALFIFVIAPLGLKLPGMDQISSFAGTHDIKVTAYYYTDIEEFARAEADLRNSLEYGPQKR